MNVRIQNTTNSDKPDTVRPFNAISNQSAYRQHPAYYRQAYVIINIGNNIEKHLTNIVTSKTTSVQSRLTTLVFLCLFLAMASNICPCHICHTPKQDKTYQV